MNVLSLFDGMSCGQIALNRLGIKVNNYFASEIDKHAIKVTKANFPDTKHLGSVVDVNAADIPKIDLLIGGSPCQSFSFAGKRKGMSTKCNQEILTLEHYLQLKNEGFEFEGQSYLFWEYMRLLKETKPKYFLLENVMMGQKWQRILSQTIGIDPIMINSSLLSAQNRKRLYWTNIGTNTDNLFGIEQLGIKQPEDLNLDFRDIILPKVDVKYNLTKRAIERVRQKQGYNLVSKKSKCLFATYYKNNSNSREGQIVDTNGILRRLTPLECERLQTVPDNYTNFVSDSQRYKMLGNGWTVSVIEYIFKHMKL